MTSEPKTNWTAHKRWHEQGGAYLYVMASEDRAKVGLSIDLKGRASAMRYLAGQPVKVVQAIWVSDHIAEALESHAQWLLGDFHARGEWFDVEPEVACEAVREAIAAYEAGEQLQRFSKRNQRPPQLLPWPVRVPTRVELVSDDEEDGSL